MFSKCIYCGSRGSRRLQKNNDVIKLFKPDLIIQRAIQIGLFLFYFAVVHDFVTASSLENNGKDAKGPGPDEDFFHLCSSGLKEEDHSKFLELIQANPHWVNERTESGESCLHLTGIYGNTELTKVLLEDFKADPNIRTTYDKGLRMHPLSWNVFAGHYDNIRLLLAHGADVNLDFDTMKNGVATPCTSLDILLELVKNEEEVDSAEDNNNDEKRFTRILRLFEKHEAKTMKEIVQNKQVKNVNGNSDDDEKDEL